ncbi:DNA-binding IclR family transcriptional regulator [Prauserella isguenensis]|uniref:Glycerol operon regulatory protein n=1 Tax=Prauserella isguenensis TaxID=1470180 RepID=A0A839S0P1_9PSEU|nr:DNA-binding IclR family transcriptional regulator [Prauserella isguenensis]
MTTSTRGSGGDVASVTRAVAVLECFEDAEHLGVTEVADRIGTAKSTAARLLATLRRAGLVEQDPETGRYMLGLRLYEWGQLTAARHALRAAARPILHGLSAEVGLTVALVFPTERGVVHVDRVEPRGAVDFWKHRGTTFSNRGAGGVVIAASRDEPEHRRPGAGSDDLATRIARARDDGYALEFGHVIDGTASLAAPVRRLAATEAAIAVIGPERSFRSRATVGRLAGLGRYAARTLETCGPPELG